jgi:hypothetical protein
MAWTVHFPVNVVEYAEQRNFCLAGPDGIIFLYGNEVTARRRANFKAAEARREEEERRKAQPQPPPLQDPQVMPPPAPASAALWRVLVELIAASKTCTICTESVPAAVAGEEAQMMAPYPHALAAVEDLTPEYLDRPDLIPVADFVTYSRSKCQRWIRRYKKYAACLRAAHRVSNNANPDHPKVASDEEDEEDDNSDQLPLADAPPEAANNNISTNATEAEEEIPSNNPKNPATEAEKKGEDKMEC